MYGRIIIIVASLSFYNNLVVASYNRSKEKDPIIDLLMKERKALKEYSQVSPHRKMNETIRVSTYINCRREDEHQIYLANMQDSWWRHNMIGCCIVEILRHMYNFNITYIIGTDLPDKYHEDIDLYANPLIMQPELMVYGNPVHTVLLWRFGFLLRRRRSLPLFYRYYSKPFARPVWNFLYVIALLSTLLFYFLTWCEKWLLKRNWPSSLVVELLFTIGGYCQHAYAVDTILNSRRLAYFTFLLYAYVIYTFYTSNLLSHLVNDKENDVKLEAIKESDYEIAVLEDMKRVLRDSHFWFPCRNMTMMSQFLRDARTLDASAALEAVRTNKTALLSDYISIYPLLKRTFKEEEICSLLQIDLYSEVRKYLFTSKHFRFREQLKVGILRAKEAGILQRLTFYDRYRPLRCDHVAPPVVEIQQIFFPCMILILTYIICTAIMFIERWYYKKHQVWPYVN